MQISREARAVPARMPLRSAADFLGQFHPAVLQLGHFAFEFAQRPRKTLQPFVVTLVMLGETLTKATRTAISRAASGSPAVTLLLAAPEFMRR